MFFTDCIAPHFFQFVKFPVFREHYVDNYIHVIDQYPLQVVEPFMVVWIFSAFFFNLVFQVFRNSPDLGLAVCFTNDEEISNSFVDLPEIEGNNILPFFLLYRGNDGFDDFRVPR